MSTPADLLNLMRLSFSLRSKLASSVPDRLDYVHFQLDYEEVSVAILLALELAERAARTHDTDARSVGAKIRRAGASRTVRLSPKELTALAGVIDAWEADAETVRALREQLPS